MIKIDCRNRTSVINLTITVPTLLSRQQKQQLLKIKARTNGLEINVKKTEQMRLNQPSDLPPEPKLVIDGEKIAIVDGWTIVNTADPTWEQLSMA